MIFPVATDREGSPMNLGTCKMRWLIRAFGENHLVETEKT
jgi:hypothetical protein